MTIEVGTVGFKNKKDYPIVWVVPYFVSVFLVFVVASAVESTTASATSVSTSTTTSGSIGSRSCLIHHQGLAQEVETIQASDSLSCCSLIGHLDKTEATAALRYFVHYNLGGRNFAILFK